ncbi:TPA: hypothetical protein U0921_000490 [Streptococcus suis]|nr:hypothetical protein [Streptococcus suis]HEM4059132.1 hypothetical protein [Streptococcus suis]
MRTILGLKGWRLELSVGGLLCIQLLKDDSWLELEKWRYFSLSLEEGTMEKFAEFLVADSRVLDR